MALLYEPFELHVWVPSPYDIDKRNSTYRGEKWLSDQASFMMEMMKFQPNVRKEIYRKGPGAFQPYKMVNGQKTYDSVDPSLEGSLYNPNYNPENPPPAPMKNYSDPDSETFRKNVWKDYLGRMSYYDSQYNGMTYTYDGSSYTINKRHFSVFAHQGPDMTNPNNVDYRNSVSVAHGFFGDQNKYRLQGYGAGEGVSENKKNGKKTEIYDFFLNFWEFDGSYEDYFSGPGLLRGRDQIAGNDRYRASFFAQPSDKFSKDQNYYRSDLKYDYVSKAEVSGTSIDRRYDAIPIYKPSQTWNIGETSYFNSFNGGKDVSTMTWNEFMRFYPTDFTSSFFGRNPAILTNDDEVPSLTGYDKEVDNSGIVKGSEGYDSSTGETFFKRAVDYFEDNEYVSRYGKANQLKADQKTYELVDRAGFYDLMMDPDSPWNHGGTGVGWWNGRNDDFAKMQAAFYIVILAVEAKRRYLQSMTQWYGPGTQFQGFDFAGSVIDRSIRSANPKKGKYVPGADQKMIDYFTSWYGDSCQIRKTGQKTGGDNIYWKAGEAPESRAAFNDLFLTAGHEMGTFMALFSGQAAYSYAQADITASVNLKAWLKEQFVKLMDPENVKDTILENIHPVKSLQTAAKEKFKEFVDTPDYDSNIDGYTTSDTWSANNDKFAHNVSVSKYGDSTFNWTWTRARSRMVSDHSTAITNHYNSSIKSQKPDWATDEELKDFYKSHLQDHYSNISASTTSTGTVSLTGLGDVNIGSNSGNRNSGDPVKVAEYSLNRHKYLKPDCASATFQKDVSYTDGEKQYQWKDPKSGEAPWDYQRRFYYPNRSNGAGEYTSWTTIGKRSTLPAYEGGQSYTATRSKTINWDAAKTYNDPTKTRTVEEKYKIEATMVWEDQDKEWTKGHKIKVIPTYVYGTGDGDLSVSANGIRTTVTYKDATEFREAYKEFEEDAARPYQDMSLATYRMERDNPDGQSIELPEHINTDRCAHQWYRKRTEINAILGLEGDPELKRLYEGGAVAELFREYALGKDSFADWRGDGNAKTDDVNPAATADYNKMLVQRIATKEKGIGSWHLSVGNLRKEALNQGWCENWKHQYTGWNASAIHKDETLYGAGDFVGDPWNNVWGLRVAYLMRGTTAYGVSQIIGARAAKEMFNGIYEEDMKQYKADKSKEQQRKQKEKSNIAEKAAKFRTMLAKAESERNKRAKSMTKSTMDQNKKRSEQRARANKKAKIV